MDIIKSFLKKFKQHIEDEISCKYGNFEVKIYPLITIKIFKNHNINNEIEILTKLNKICPYTIKMLDYEKSHNIIIYETINPILEYRHHINMNNLLYDIGLAVFMIHINGFIHGDVALSNIGIKNNNYILYDFEKCKKNNTPEKRFIDVEMFLEDLELNSQEHIIKFIKNNMQKNHKTNIGTEKKPIYIYNYNPQDFLKYITNTFIHL